jgi:hypothetical protein
VYIPNSVHKSFPHRSKWLSNLLTYAVDSLHRAGLHDKARELMEADNRWVEYWKNNKTDMGSK